MRAVGVLVPVLAVGCAPAVQGRAPATTVVTAVDRATLDRLVRVLLGRAVELGPAHAD
jgi:hypothetical protein